MMRYKIVLVPFPFDDFQASKVRPAICLTEPTTSHNHLVIAFITSRIEIADEESDLLLLQSDPEFTDTGLHKDSAIRLHRLISVPVSLIKRELGTLPEYKQTLLKKKLKQLFGL